MEETTRIFSVTLRIWRQNGPRERGKMEQYQMPNVTPEMYFFDILDALNERLIKKGEQPVAFETGCREGSCGACGLIINGEVNGPAKGLTACRLKMRAFKDGDVITVEPWRIKSFPVIRDLAVDRTALDRIAAAGGFISANVAAAPEAGSVPVIKSSAEEALLCAS